MEVEISVEDIAIYNVSMNTSDAFNLAIHCFFSALMYVSMKL